MWKEILFSHKYKTQMCSNSASANVNIFFFISLRILSLNGLKLLDLSAVVTDLIYKWGLTCRDHGAVFDVRGF